MNGFSFCGTHCSAYGIGFAPSAAKRMQSMPTFKTIEETDPERAGGYWYGNQVEVRTFTLECYFEEINTDTYERMLQWLHRDQEGKLVFDDRPFVYYMVRPSKVVEGKSYSSFRPCKNNTDEIMYSGTLTITFSAYDPYGKMEYIAYDGFDADGAMHRCGIVELEEMPPALSPTLGDFLVYNPGTEITNTVIRIAGTAPNGLKITNRTTGDVCELTSLPSSVQLILDSEDGSVRTSDFPNGTAFEYHDMGYIRLAPCTPYYRNTAVTYNAGSNVIEFPVLPLSERNVGQYIRLAGEWLRIIYVSENTAVVNKNMTESGMELAMLATMNEISVEGDGASLTVFEMDYVPCVR